MFSHENAIVIKYGGNAMTDSMTKRNVIRDIARLYKGGLQPVVVHGGGPAITALLQRLGLESEFVGGHRKTTAESMEAVEMALCATVNNDLVKRLNRAGAHAVGLSGKDGRLITARKRVHRVRRGQAVVEVDLGLVGEVATVDRHVVDTLMNAGYVPVIAPVAVGEDGLDYNINADLVAGAMARAMGASCLVYLTNTNGILRNPEKKSTRIPLMTAGEARSHMGDIITGGMLPKVESCIRALEGGVKSAHIINAGSRRPLSRLLLEGELLGTTLTAPGRKKRRRNHSRPNTGTG